MKECQSSMDGGQFWSRESKKCVESCEFYNETARICEKYEDEGNCPYFKIDNNHKVCVKTCGDKYFIDKDATVNN